MNRFFDNMAWNVYQADLGQTKLGDSRGDMYQWIPSLVWPLVHFNK
jgi:hypothetical protein